MSTPITSIPLQTINGEPSSLADYSGKVLLAVNVASKCGLTPQYEALERLYRSHAYRGLVAQAPAAGNPEDFRAKLNGYGIEPNPAPQVLWNFEKFLVGRDGRVAARLAPNMAPDDPALVAAIEAELAK